MYVSFSCMFFRRVDLDIFGIYLHLYLHIYPLFVQVFSACHQCWCSRVCFKSSLVLQEHFLCLLRCHILCYVAGLYSSSVILGVFLERLGVRRELIHRPLKKIQISEKIMVGVVGSLLEGFTLWRCNWSWNSKAKCWISTHLFLLLALSYLRSSPFLPLLFLLQSAFVSLYHTLVLSSFYLALNLPLWLRITLVLLLRLHPFLCATFFPIAFLHFGPCGRHNFQSGWCRSSWRMENYRLHNG